MIYLRLHQARSEEIERGASRVISLQERENFAIAAKFRYNSETSLQQRNFATPKISLQ